MHFLTGGVRVRQVQQDVYPWVSVVAVAVFVLPHLWVAALTSIACTIDHIWSTRSELWTGRWEGADSSFLVEPGAGCRPLPSQVLADLLDPA
jgi:hypothetical protein